LIAKNGCCFWRSSRTRRNGEPWKNWPNWGLRTECCSMGAIPRAWRSGLPHTAFDREFSSETGDPWQRISASGPASSRRDRMHWSRLWHPRADFPDAADFGVFGDRWIWSLSTAATGRAQHKVYCVTLHYSFAANRIVPSRAPSLDWIVCKALAAASRTRGLTSRRLCVSAAWATPAGGPRPPSVSAAARRTSE